MIYVKLEKNKEYYLATLIHYKPFDEVYGLKKTEIELLKEGIFVESLPKKLVLPEGQVNQLRATLNNKEIYYGALEVEI